MKNQFSAFLIAFFSVFALIHAHADTPTSFSQAKHIAGQIFAENPITLYCGCHYDSNTKKIDLSSCNMQSAADRARAHRLEWEHMMPAENFGRQLICWQQAVCTKDNGVGYKGRKCCDKSSPEFRRMEAELYNLWPSVGLVNQARSNYRYNQFSSTPPSNDFYGCPILIDKLSRKVEPRAEAKGIVARANLFMAQQYGIALSPQQHHLFEAWDKQYPPGAWEKTWAAKVAAIEGYPNPFITQHGLN